MNYGMELVPLEASPSPCFLISYNLSHRRDGCPSREVGERPSAIKPLCISSARIDHAICEKRTRHLREMVVIMTLPIVTASALVIGSSTVCT